MIVTSGTKVIKRLAMKPYGRKKINMFDAKHVKGM
jgi:hypothetical protein